MPLETSGVNAEQANEELDQLREKLAVISSQYAQLDESTQAWQAHHQSQLNNFRSKIQECIEVDDDFSLDQIAQQIVDQTNSEREEFVERYDFLEQRTKFEVFSEHLIRQSFFV